MPQCIRKSCKAPRAKGSREFCAECFQAMLEEIANEMLEKKKKVTDAKLQEMLDKQASLLDQITS